MKYWKQDTFFSWEKNSNRKTFKEIYNTKKKKRKTDILKEESSGQTRERKDKSFV